MTGNTLSTKARQAPFAPSAYTFAIGTEPMIDMPEAAKVWGEWFGRQPHKNHLRRLCTKPNRHGLVLPTVMVAGRRMTSEGAIRWFVESCTAANNAIAGSGGAVGVGLTPDERATLVRAGVLEASEV